MVARQVRATPARVARALRLVKRSLYERRWHLWCTQHEDLWAHNIKPYVMNETWDSTEDIAIYVYAMLFRLPTNAENRRRDWSHGAYRRYMKLVNADRVI